MNLPPGYSAQEEGEYTDYFDANGDLLDGAESADEVWDYWADVSGITKERYEELLQKEQNLEKAISCINKKNFSYGKEKGAALIVAELNKIQKILEKK